MVPVRLRAPLWVAAKRIGWTIAAGIMACGSLGYFRRVLQDHLAARGQDLDKLLRSVRIVPRCPKGPPQKRRHANRREFFNEEIGRYLAGQLALSKKELLEW